MKQGEVNIEDLIGEEPKKERNKGGRPPLYATVEALEAKINEYFDQEIAPKQLKDENGEPMWTGIPVLTKSGRPQKRDGQIVYEPGSKRPVMGSPKPPTVAGLALYLGFSDYRSVYKNAFRENREFNHVIKNAISRIADYAQQQLFVGQSTGAIFWLKNHGWRDRSETELTGKDGGPVQTEDLTKKDRGILAHFIKNHKEKAEDND